MASTRNERATVEPQTEAVLKALTSPVRREILWRIWDEEHPVATIAAGFDLSAPTISNHLAVLREAGLVDVRPAGTTRWYRARQDTLTDLRHLLPQDPTKWVDRTEVADLEPGAGLTRRVVVVTTEAGCSVEEAFAAFTDPVLYSQWLGAPVTIEGRHFTAEMDFGVVVRGTYDLVCAPSLIVMSWDFGSDEVPTPGATLAAQLVIAPRGSGESSLHLHQFVETDEQAHFLGGAWNTVLRRFATGIRSVLDRGEGPSPH